MEKDPNGTLKETIKTNDFGARNKFFRGVVRMGWRNVFPADTAD